MELREVFEPIVKFLKNLQKKDKEAASKDFAKERLQLVLMQDRASVSPDFFEMMKKEIIEVIKKYIEIDEESLEVQLTRGFEEGDGTGPALFANIPIKNIKPVAKKVEEKEEILAVEMIDDSEFVEELSSENNEKIVEAAAEENVSNVEEVEVQDNNVVENIETVQNEEEKIEEKSKLEASVETSNVEVAEENANIEDVVKDRIAEVKDGVAETIEMVKKGAKDGIKKIKTKTQKKKINE